MPPLLDPKNNSETSVLNSERAANIAVCPIPGPQNSTMAPIVGTRVVEMLLTKRVW
jgi:hypothetical protein